MTPGLEIEIWQVMAVSVLLHCCATPVNHSREIIISTPCQLPTRKINGEAGRKIEVTLAPTAFSPACGHLVSLAGNIFQMMMGHRLSRAT